MRAASPGEVRRAQPWLGTLVEIAAAGASARVLERGMRAAFAAVAEVHRLLSFHDPLSELSRLNREAATRAIVVHPWTWRVLRLADRIAEKSAGIFDPTIAPRLTALDFLPHPGAPSAKASARWSDVHLDAGRRVRFACPLWLDLGGIAKGFAVDRAIEALRAAGIPEGLVNAGGDLRAFGPRAWPVHLRAPDSPGRSDVVLELQDAALATSALYFSKKTRARRLLTPLLHGRTRRCCTAARSVTILARDCATADALTKVVFARPRCAGAILRAFRARALVLAAGRAPVQIPQNDAP